MRKIVWDQDKAALWYVGQAVYILEDISSLSGLWAENTDQSFKHSNIDCEILQEFLIPRLQRIQKAVVQWKCVCYVFLKLGNKEG